MKRLLALACIALSLPAAAAGVNLRQDVQQVRIAQGVQSGALNSREAARLQGRQAHIAAVEARDRADGRGFTLHERAKVQRMQDRSSAAIARQKNDRQ